jgi:signal transduction histidine kinase
LLLYLLVLTVLAVFARRISRPLSKLKEAMAAFGDSGRALPIEEAGPSDIRQLVASYNGMQHRLDALLSEKDVMLGAIGHDLKTPLSSLRVRVESVDDDDERDQMVASIDEMSAILNDILTLARMGKSGEPVQLTDISALVDTVLDDFALQYGRLVFHPPGSPISGNIRPMLLRRALRNLISNALRYGGNAEIHVESKGHVIEVTILDNGPGIAGTEIEAMFEPFARADASRNKLSGGTGLGLTIARAIARAHGGDVTLANRAEGGLAAKLSVVTKLP